MQLVTKRLEGCIFLHCNPAQSQPITCITIYRYFALRHTAWICHTAFERFIEGCMALYKCLDPYIYASNNESLQLPKFCSTQVHVASNTRTAQLSLSKGKTSGIYLLYHRKQSDPLVKYLSIVTHDVAKPGQKPSTGGYFWMHGAIDIVQQVESLADQFVTLVQQTLLYLRLATRKNVVRISCLDKQHS